MAGNGGRLRLLGLLAIALAAGLQPAAGGADPAATLHSRAAHLRVENTILATRSHHALLGLYSLEARLTRARGQLESLRSRAAAVERARAENRRRLALARRVLGRAQTGLAARLQILYEQGTPDDALAVLLGATSLDEALSTLDTLDRTASQDRLAVAQVRAARERFARMARSLAAREAELKRLQAAASAAAASLERARVARVGFISQLAARRHLNAAQISSLSARARTIQTKAEAVTAEATATVTAVPPVPQRPEAPAPPLSTPTGATMIVLATGYALGGTTATGAPVGWGVVAVDPTVIPLGTRLTIPGYGVGIAADTGPAVQGAMIDLWFPSAAQAAAWGKRTVTITLH